METTAAQGDVSAFSTALEQQTLMAKAMSHPVRARALEILNQRVASPSTIARELGLPVANVSYHVNTLHRLGCIEEVAHRHVRGSIEHLYRAVRRSELQREDLRTLPEEVREGVVGQFGERAAAEWLDAARAGDLTREGIDFHLSVSPLMLDEEGYAELLNRMAALMDWANAGLQAECAARIGDGGAGGAPVDGRLIACAFQRSHDTPDAP